MKLLDRLTRLYEHGHRTPAQNLYEDWRPLPENPLRPAAVLIAVTDRGDHPDGPGVLLIHRPSHMRAHPGQAAFPGGKIDPGAVLSSASPVCGETSHGSFREDTKLIHA